MAVLIVVGLMNLLRMAGIFIVFVIEEHWRLGVALAKVVGAALIVQGVIVIVQPTVLALVSR